MTIVRREPSAESAARFFEARKARRLKKRRAQNKRRLLANRTVRRADSSRSDALRDAIVSSLRTAGIMADLERSAWIPASPVRQMLSTSPIAPLPAKPRILESNAERLRRYRADAVARGLCYVCRARDVKLGTRYCEVCLEKGRKYQESIAYKRCQTCGVDLNGRKALLCVECTAKSSAGYRRMWNRRVADGTCGRCGKRPLHQGHKQCVSCLDEMRDRILVLQRDAGRKPRPCPACRELGIDGTGHDRRTHDRWMERRKQWAP